MPVKTPRNKEVEAMTHDGFTKMRVTMNLSMPCSSCNEKPKEFYWKPVRGEKTIVFCIGCSRNI